MATKNEKTLAQAICGLTDLLSLLKPQLNQALDEAVDTRWANDAELAESGKVPDDLAPLYDLLGIDNPIRKLAEGILAEEETAPVSVAPKGVGGPRFSFINPETGMNCLNIPNMSQEERDAMGVCVFTIYYGGKHIMDIYWDPTLNWILQPNEDKTEFKPVAKRRCPGQGASSTGTIRNFLAEIAEKEIEKPGTFAEKYYVTAPKVFVRK